MDLDLYEQLNGLADRYHALEEVFRFFAQEGQVVFLVLLACLFFARGKWRSRNGRHGVAAAGFSALLALGVAQVIGSLWDRPRPYEAHPGDAHLLLAPSPDPSFPSDHATAAYAIALAILLRHRKAGILALILATLVAVSRVALGTHYPTDVLGGAALGALAALLLWAPSIRRPLHRLADWTGALYDRTINSLRRRRTPPQTPESPPSSRLRVVQQASSQRQERDRGMPGAARKAAAPRVSRAMKAGVSAIATPAPAMDDEEKRGRAIEPRSECW